MRRLLSLTLALFCLICAVPTAQAAGKKYKLPELNMTITAPKGWYVFTQDVKEDDPNLKKLGKDGKGLAEFFRNNGIYLDMEIADPLAQISVLMTESESSRDIYDFNLLTDKELKSGMETAPPGAEKLRAGNQLKYTESFIYKHKQAKFYVRLFTSPVNNTLAAYGTEYLTVINGQSIDLKLLYIRESKSDSLEKTLKSVVDSIVFTKVTRKPAAPAKTYQLPELNMTIDAPGGWYAFTQNVDKDDPDLKDLGMDGEKLADQFKENNIYLDMINAEPYTQIFVTLIDSESSRRIYDFNLLTDKELKSGIETVKPGTEKLTEDNQVKYAEGFIYRHKQAKFYVYDYTLKLDNSKTTYGTLYETVINGQRISLNMVYQDKGKSKSLKQTLKNTVDSITFTKVTPKPISLAETYELPELNMSIASIEGWLVFTQDIDENDPDIKLFGAEAKAFEIYLKENDFYFYTIGKDPDAYITVKMTEPDAGEDFNDMADEDLLLTAFHEVEQIDKDADFSNCSVYAHKQTKFAVCDFTDKTASETLYEREYYTVINGQAICILMASPEGEITGTLAKMLQDTVDSITFTKVGSQPVPKAPDAATYELPKLNMKVDSPKGWFVFTRDVKEDDPNLNALGLDGKSLADQYKKDGIYLHMISLYPYAEINVMTVDSGSAWDTSDDFNNMADDDLRTVAYTEMVKAGAKPDISDISVYTHKQTKFAVLDYDDTSDGKKVYSKVYFTVINRQAVCIKLLSSKAEISDSYAQALKDTVDGITFTKRAPEDDSVAVLASLAGAVIGAIIGAAVISIRKRRYA